MRAVEYPGVGFEGLRAQVEAAGLGELGEKFLKWAGEVVRPAVAALLSKGERVTGDGTFDHFGICSAVRFSPATEQGGKAFTPSHLIVDTGSNGFLTTAECLAKQEALPKDATEVWSC